MNSSEEFFIGADVRRGEACFLPFLYPHFVNQIVILCESIEPLGFAEGQDDAKYAYCAQIANHDNRFARALCNYISEVVNSRNGSVHAVERGFGTNIFRRVVFVGSLCGDFDFLPGFCDDLNGQYFKRFEEFIFGGGPDHAFCNPALERGVFGRSQL